MRTLVYRSRVYLLVRTLVLRWKSRQVDLSDPSRWVQRVPPDQFGRNLRTLMEMGQEHRFRTAFLLEPLRDRAEWPQTAAHREEARRLAASSGIVLVDGFELFAAMDDAERAALFEDRIHLNPAGHQKLEELLEQRLREAKLLRQDLHPARG